MSRVEARGVVALWTRLELENGGTGLTSSSGAIEAERGFRLRRTDVPLALVVAYVVALLAIPNDIGLHLGAFVLSPSRVILGVLIALVLVDRSLRDTLRSAPKLVLLAWIAFLASAAITTFFNYSSQSLSRYGSLALEGLALWAIVWCVARNRHASDALQLSIVATTTLVAGVTILLAALGLNYGDAIRTMSLTVVTGSEVRFGLSRQAGSFTEPLFFATWLVGASMLTLRWLEAERRPIRILAWVAWTILLVALIETVSRTCIVGDLAATGVYFFFRRRPVIGVVMVVLALLAALAMSGYLPALPNLPSLWGKTPDAASTAATAVAAKQALDGSTAMRLESLQAAWPVLLQRPLFGWGLLMAGPVLTTHLGHPSYVDNTYLTWLVEIGVIGTAAFLLLILSALRMAVPLSRSPAQLSRVFALAMLVGLVVFASFLSITQGYAGFVLIFALVTLGAEAPAPELAAAPA